MFEQFTVNALKVIMEAQKSAKLLNHNFVGTEHILIGLIDERFKSYEILNNLNLKKENVLLEIEKLTLEKCENLPEVIPFSQNAKVLLQIAAYLAYKNLHPVNELYLLFALILTSGKHEQIFENSDVNIDKIKDDINSKLDNTEIKLDNNAQIISFGYVFIIAFFILFSYFVLNNLITNLHFGYKELFSMLGIIISTFFVRNFLIFKFGVGRVPINLLKLIRIICLIIGILFISVLLLTILIYVFITIGKYKYSVY